MTGGIAECSTIRVAFKYKLGRKLVGDRTAASQLLHILDVITESQFVNGVALAVCHLRRKVL